MKELYSVRGIITVLNTPFDASGAVDLAALRRHVSYAIEAGVVGILVPAMAAEVQKLTLPERLGMVAATLEESRGRVPVIAGAGEPDVRRRIELVSEYLKLGCPHVLVQIPFHTPEQFRDEVHRVADAGPGLLMLQDWDAAGEGLPVPLIARLFEEVESFRCLKIETALANQKYTAVIAATGGRLHLSGGWAVTTMLEALERGVHAFMPTGLHEIYTLIHTLFVEGRREEAETWFNRVLPILAFSNQHLDLSIHFFKRLLHAQGIYGTAAVRQPILRFDEHHERRAARLIPYALQLCSEAARHRSAARSDD